MPTPFILTILNTFHKGGQSRNQSLIGSFVDLTITWTKRQAVRFIEGCLTVLNLDWPESSVWYVGRRGLYCKKLL